MKATLPIRGQDAHGSGEFRARRVKTDANGNRVEYEHEGADYACYPGTTIYPDCGGQVTKIGYPYADDLAFRYVEVTDAEGLRWRYFYVDPSVESGQRVNESTPLGKSQKLSGRYKKITNHVHLEVLRDGWPVDPESV